MDNKDVNMCYKKIEKLLIIGVKFESFPSDKDFGE